MLITTNSQNEFQQEGSMDVRPFLDPGDGGSLDKTSHPQIPIVFIFLFSIFALYLILQKILPILSLLEQTEQKKEDRDRVFISHLETQYSLSQSKILSYLNQLKIEVRSETKNKKTFTFIDVKDSEHFKNYINQNSIGKESSQTSQKPIETLKNSGSSVKRDTLLNVLPSENGCRADSVGRRLKLFQGKLPRLKLIPKNPKRLK